MTPLEKKPFYAVQVEACAYSTCGGVRGDREARAIGHDDLPIKGLFVCGIDNGSMQFNDYPYGLHGGSGQGAACTTGYVAANAACKIWVLPSDHLTDDFRSPSAATKGIGGRLKAHEAGLSHLLFQIVARKLAAVVVTSFLLLAVVGGSPRRFPLFAS